MFNFEYLPINYHNFMMDTTEQTNKKLRSTNWDDQEKELLKKLVLERAHIIERKDTKAKTNNAKKIAWKEILLCFNAVNPKKRDITQLHNQWRNYKTRSKQAKIAHRRASDMTNGDPPSPPSEDQELIQEVPQELSIDPISHDSDHVYCEKELELESIQNGCMPSTLTLIQNESEQHSSDDSKTDLFSSTAQPSHEDSFQTWDRPGPLGSTPTIKPKRKKYKSPCCKINHEHQIYILARTARKETMLRDKEAHYCKMMYERELHEKRKAIMALEEDYWRMKIRKLKEI